MNDLSIIIPVYNNEQSLKELNNKILKSIKEIKIKKFSIIYVDDFSTDDSLKILNSFKKKIKNIRIIKLKKNSGQTNATKIGITKSYSKYYFTLAADLQDDPKLIKIFYKEIKNKKIDIVLFAKKNLQGTTINKFFSFLHWKLMNVISGKKFPKYGCDVFGFSNNVKTEVFSKIKFIESTSIELFKSLRNKKIIYFTKMNRKHGTSSHTFKKKFQTSINQILALKSLSEIFWYFSFFIIGSFIISGLVIFFKFIFAEFKTFDGWRSLILLNLMSFSLILFNFALLFRYLNKLNSKITSLKK